MTNNNRADTSLAAAVTNLVATYISSTPDLKMTPGEVKDMLVDVIHGIRSAATDPIAGTEAAVQAQSPQTETQTLREPTAEMAQSREAEAPAQAQVAEPAAAVEATQARATPAEPEKSLPARSTAKSKSSSKPAPKASAAKAQAAKPSPAKSSAKAVPQTKASEPAPELPLSSDKGKTAPTETVAPVSEAGGEPVAPPVKMTVNERKRFAKDAYQKPVATTKAALDAKFGKRLDVARIPFEGVKPEETLTKMPGYVICLFDGQPRKMLHRWLRSEYGMRPEEYRLWWGLDSDYPMTSPGYSGEKSDYAKEVGLGTSRFIEKAKAKKTETVAEDAPAAKAAQETVAEQPTPKSERVVRSRPRPGAAQKKKSRATA